ncbi:hypothetical protein ES703_53268 [subsurface metagenome]
MSLLLKGITKISELEIDADKDWQGKGISNIKEIAEAMATGQIAQFDGTRLAKLLAGIENNVLTSQGLGHLVVWATPGSYFARYLPVTIDLSHALAIVVPDKTWSKECLLPTEHEQNYLDAPADYIKRLTPAIALADAEAIVTVDQSHNKNVPIASQGGVQLLVDGAVAEDGGVFTDETGAAQDAVANDMTLLPVCTNGGLAVGDAYYFGFVRTWDRLWLNIGTAGVGNYALAHEYWDGDSWELLPDFVDATSEFTIAGLNKMDFTRPGDWATTNKGGDLPATVYWIRARVTAVVTYTTQPLGTQAWCEVLI